MRVTCHLAGVPAPVKQLTIVSPQSPSKGGFLSKSQNIAAGQSVLVKIRSSSLTGKKKMAKESEKEKPEKEKDKIKKDKGGKKLFTVKERKVRRVTWEKVQVPVCSATL